MFIAGYGLLYLEEIGKMVHLLLSVIDRLVLNNKRWGHIFCVFMNFQTWTWLNSCVFLIVWCHSEVNWCNKLLKISFVYEDMYTAYILWQLTYVYSKLSPKMKYFQRNEFETQRLYSKSQKSIDFIFRIPFFILLSWKLCSHKHTKLHGSWVGSELNYLIKLRSH